MVCKELKNVFIFVSWSLLAYKILPPKNKTIIIMIIIIIIIIITIMIV